MSRKLTVVLPALEDFHRDRIREAADRLGFQALFFDSEAAAVPELAEAEIVLGQSAFLAGHSPRVRWFCTPSAGVDHLTGEGVFASPDALLTSSSGAYGVTIAEHIVMVALELLRRQADYSAVVARRGWERGLPVRSLLESKITLLGTGDIGQEAALRLRAFRPACLTGVNRSGRNPEGRFDRVLPVTRLDEALPETEVLICSLPATPETRRLLDARRLALLPDQAVLINVGRGSLLEEGALEAELRAGRLHAALDVFETEPLPPESSLWTCPNLLITPHVAGNMTLAYTRRRIVDLFLENLERYAAGEPLRRLVSRAQ